MTLPKTASSEVSLSAPQSLSRD